MQTPPGPFQLHLGDDRKKKWELFQGQQRLPLRCRPNPIRTPLFNPDASSVAAGLLL